MKEEEFSGKRKRMILEGMIYDSESLSKICQIWDREYSFTDQASSTIGQLCVEFYQKYGHSPGDDIVVLAQAWVDKHPSEDKREDIGSCIGGIRSQHDVRDPEEKLNPGMVIEFAREEFSEIKFDKLTKKAEGYRKSGKIDEAFTCLSKLAPVQLGKGSGVHLFTDKEAVKSAFVVDPRDEVFIQYPDDLGKFFGNVWRRDGFVAFVAPEGVGKTWWLIDVAYRALTQRKRVAYYEAGDLTERELDLRLLVRNAGRPLEAGSYRCPSLLTKDDIDYENRNHDKPLSFERAWRGCERLMRSQVRSKNSYFYREVHPNRSINVQGIQNSLENRIREGWIPDVVIIDYADILAPPPGYQRMDGREQINETWMQLRRLSQMFHCLTVTATQVNRKGYTVSVIKREHMSEDKRKLAHIDAMIAINQTEEEKELGVYRLSPVKTRHMKTVQTRCVRVASCLEIGNPAVLSWFAGWNITKDKGPRKTSTTPSANGEHQE